MKENTFMSRFIIFYESNLVGIYQMVILLCCKSLLNKESGCVWFKEQDDFLLIRAFRADSQIGQLKHSNKVYNICQLSLWADLFEQRGVQTVWYSDHSLKSLKRGGRL